MTEEKTDWDVQLERLLNPPEEEAVYILIHDPKEKKSFKILGVFACEDQAQRIKNVVIESGLDKDSLGIHKEVLYEPPKCQKFSPTPQESL